MLVSDDVSDTSAVDTEHADNSGVLDLITELLSLIAMLQNELAELSRLGLGLFVGKLSDNLVWVELVLFFVDMELLEILVKRLNALVDLLLKALILLVDPSVLIWESLLVLLGRGLWHLGGLHWDLQVHFLVGLEEVRHELLLELRDLLELNET